MSMTIEAFARNKARPAAIVAHRGTWHLAPENSLRAIRQTIAGGYDFAEIDVQTSRDGTLFLMHDLDLERMTGVAGDPQSLTIEELRRLTLRKSNGGPHAEASDQHIPTLEEALATSSGRVFFDVDTKFPEQLPQVAEAVARAGAAGFANVKTPLADRDDLSRIELLRARFGVTIMAQTRFSTTDSDRLIALLLEAAPPMVETKFDTFETLEKVLVACDDAGIAVWVNTLDPVSCCGLTDSAALDDPEAVWGRLIDAGVSLIQTDVPDCLRRFRDHRRKSVA
jgi:glycerophosphoryl diester phosphodiesterase